MKKLIDGKLYNTETATIIGEHINWHGSFMDVVETLYRTQKGAWFLHGKRSTNSIIGDQINVEGLKTNGENIIVFDEQAAYNWLKEHDLVNEIEVHFPNMIEEA